MEVGDPFLFLGDDVGGELVFDTDKLLEGVLLDYLLIIRGYGGLGDKTIVQRLSFFVVLDRCNVAKGVQILFLPLVDSSIELWPLA